MCQTQKTSRPKTVRVHEQTICVHQKNNTRAQLSTRQLSCSRQAPLRPKLKSSSKKRARAGSAAAHERRDISMGLSKKRHLSISDISMVFSFFRSLGLRYMDNIFATFGCIWIMERRMQSRHRRQALQSQGQWWPICRNRTWEVHKQIGPALVSR